MTAPPEMARPASLPGDTGRRNVGAGSLDASDVTTAMAPVRSDFSHGCDYAKSRTADLHVGGGAR